MQIEGDRVRLVLADHGKCRRPQRRDQSLHSLVADGFEQEPGKGLVVLDDQQDLVSRLDVVTVVAGLVDKIIEIGFGRRFGQERPMTIAAAASAGCHR